MNIQATEAAIRQIERSVKARKSGIGIKIGVRTTGCSGMAYTIEFLDQEDSNDYVNQFGSIKIAVSPKHAPYLEGIVLDFKREGLNEGFSFDNPNERNRCGCGESFTV